MSNMTYGEAREKAIAYYIGELELSRPEIIEIQDKLMATAWDAALLLDKLSGVDPYKGPSGPYGGTANKKSTTYKVRKALGYSYP